MTTKILTANQLNAAKLNVIAYLESRRDTLVNCEEVDKGNTLAEYYALGITTAEQTDSGFRYKLTDEILNNLITEAPQNRLAYDLLKNYAQNNPSNPKLAEVMPVLLGKPPKDRKGRPKNPIRDFILLGAIGVLVDAGLSKPKDKPSKPHRNSAHVLEEVLLEMKIKGAVLGSDSLVNIYKNRNDVYKRGLKAASIFGR